MAYATPKYPHSRTWPTKEKYLWLLRMEACRRGFLFNSNEIDVLPGCFSSDDAFELHAWGSTPDQWLDVTGCTIQPVTLAVRRAQGTGQATSTTDGERQTLLKDYAWLHLEGIMKNIQKRLLEAGVETSQRPYTYDAVLRDISTLWASTMGKVVKEDKRRVRIGLLSDIPQEETAIEYIEIPFNLNFASFKTEAARLGVVRYLTKKHHPALAETLFLDDEVVYHHPYPVAPDESDPSFAAQIYPVTRDYEAEDNGWHSHVVPPDATSMCNQQRDWRPINSEADWQSMLRFIKASNRKVFMRHKSVQDRMDLIKRHKEREELEIAKTAGAYTNLFLRRHMEAFASTDKLEGMNS